MVAVCLSGTPAKFEAFISFPLIHLATSPSDFMFCVKFHDLTEPTSDKLANPFEHTTFSDGITDG